MAIKELINKELSEFKSWAQDATFQARLVQSEATSELRKRWMEAEKTIAKLEAKLEELGSDADETVDLLRAKLKDTWAKLKS